MWQLDFSEYETTAGGIWRLADVTDYFSKYEHGWHISPTSTGADAIAAAELAIAEAGRLGGAPLPRLLLLDRLAGGEPGGADPQLGAGCVAGSDLTLEDRGEVFLMGPAGITGVIGQPAGGFGDPGCLQR